MKIIAVMSPKGGIGKTTTSDSIAYMLGEEQGKRVLVLDGDPQGDTSKTFGVYEPDGIGMSELLEKHECVGGTYKTGDLIDRLTIRTLTSFGEWLSHENRHESAAQVRG